MTRHQYGISAFVPQTSFRWETSGGVIKCPLFLRLLKISHTSKLMKEFSILKRLTLPQFMFLKLFLVVPGLTYASFMTILRGFSGTGLPFVAVLSVQG